MNIDIERLKVDESLWPEGASFYSELSESFLRKSTGGSWLKLSGNGDWLLHNVSHKRIIPRPEPATEWDGEGLPPVGCECEVWFDDGRECWHRARVLCEHSIENNLMAVVLEHEPHENKLIWVDQFRPIRTKAERDRDELANIIIYGDMPPRRAIQIANNILAAGWQKPE